MATRTSATQISAWRQQYGSDPESQRQGVVKVIRRARRFVVASPYDPKFVVGAKSFRDSRWRFAAAVWSFKLKDAQAVGRLIAACYGLDKVPAWMRE